MPSKYFKKRPLPSAPLASTARRHSSSGRRYTTKDFGKRFAAWRALPAKRKILRALRFSLILSAWGILAVVIAGSVGAAMLMKDLPDPERLQERDLAQSTKIYDRTGQTLLYEIHGDEKRTVIPLADLPTYVYHATIAIEDKDFYTHPGFSIRRILVTAVTNVIEGESAGASTLTQQFVKNSILTTEKTYTRKLKELILSIQIERTYSKDEILEMYMNEIPYGSNAYGVESAAQTYFAKHAKDLSLAESATLAALPQRPTYFWNHQDELLSRKDYILDQMVEQGYATREEVDTAKQQEIVFQRLREDIVAPHFVLSYIRPYLEERYGAEVVERGGLTVITTLDVDHQKWAEEAVTGGKQRVTDRGGSNAAMVSIDTKTKQLLSMVGSFDYYDSENDGQTNAANPPTPRSPGSSLKPILYATAFEKGFTPNTRVWDLGTDFIGNGVIWPHNFDFKERGPITLRTALQGSLNIPAVRLLSLVGFDAFYDNVEALGYTTFADRPAYLSIVLGGGGVRLVEHTYAFSILAREGEKHPLTSVLKVTAADGEVLEEWKESDPVQAFNRDAVRTLNNVLIDDEARSYIFGRGSFLTLPGRQAAVKTGTSTGNVDNWTVGYTPSIAAGVWVGNNDNSPMNRNADGSGTAAPIWNAYMRKATANHPAETFTPPTAKNPTNSWLRGEIDEILKLDVDSITGKVIPDACKDSYPREYITTKEFKVTHNELHYIDRFNIKGDPPKNPETLKGYDRWEKPVAAWAAGQGGYLTGEPEYENCGLRDPAKHPSVTIVSPSDSEHMTPDNFNIRTQLSAGEGLTFARSEYLIDDTLVDTRTSSPFQTTYEPSNLTPGKHTLTVRGTNNLGNTSSASVVFYFDLSESQTLKIVEPKETELLSNTDETIALSVSDASAISTIRVYEVRAGLEALINTISRPKANSQTVAWNTGVAGSVEIYFSVEYKEGGAQSSPRASYTIVDPPTSP